MAEGEMAGARRVEEVIRVKCSAGEDRHVDSGAEGRGWPE